MDSSNIHAIVVRLAPSPSGRMHAGNIASALITWLCAKLCDGEVVLRIEDLDRSRSKASFAELICQDFETYGITWDRGPYFQSQNNEYYEYAFQQLSSSNNVYPCFCSRADLLSARAPHSQEYVRYQGTCRHLSKEQIEEKEKQKDPAYRLVLPNKDLEFDDLFMGACRYNLESDCGDVIIKRSDGSFSYQLAVCVDDAFEGVNLVTRGCDLAPSTPVQMYIHQSLGNKIPLYAHIPLLVCADGRRLSKRNKDASIEEMLRVYKTPEGILGHIAFLYGLINQDESVTAEDLRKELSFAQLKEALGNNKRIIWKA